MYDVVARKASTVYLKGGVYEYDEHLFLFRKKTTGKVPLQRDQCRQGDWH
jgi:hypothetical protein